MYCLLPARSIRYCLNRCKICFVYHYIMINIGLIDLKIFTTQSILYVEDLFLQHDGNKRKCYHRIIPLNRSLFESLYSFFLANENRRMNIEGKRMKREGFHGLGWRLGCCNNEKKRRVWSSVVRARVDCFFFIFSFLISKLLVKVFLIQILKWILILKNYKSCIY